METSEDSKKKLIILAGNIIDSSSLASSLSLLDFSVETILPENYEPVHLLAEIERFLPEIIVMDTSGLSNIIELAYAIKSHEPLKYKKLIVYTDGLDSRERSRALENGVDYLYEKNILEHDAAAGKITKIYKNIINK